MIMYIYIYIYIYISYVYIICMHMYWNMPCASAMCICHKMSQDECHETELDLEVSDQNACSGCLVSSSLGVVQFCTQTTEDRSKSNQAQRPPARDWALDDSNLRSGLSAGFPQEVL